MLILFFIIFHMSNMLGYSTTNLIKADIIFLNEAKNYLKNFNYLKTHDQLELTFPQFPLEAIDQSSLQTKTFIPESFVAELSNAFVYSDKGLILVNNHIIDEFLWPYGDLRLGKNKLEIPKTNPQKISGKVAVITQESCFIYYHWITEFLPKLILLKESKIEYDYLYVPRLTLNYMTETLELLGIDQNKIIQADKNTLIEADLLIIPSFAPQALISPSWVIDYLRKIFIPAANAKIKNKDFTSKKVFISRKKSSRRKIINEDDIFNALIPEGFNRYYLEDLSFSEQVLLFNNADIIVAAHGSALTNIIFSKPGTHVIEIFQTLKEECFWRLSHMLGFNHTCIKTKEFKDCSWEVDTSIDQDSIEKIITSVKSIK